MKKQFIPLVVNIPEHLQTHQFSFVVLEPSIAEQDYDAVMSSKSRLRQVFSENGQWPEDSMTLESNVEDLARHEREFNCRKSFAYAVLSPCHSRYIGCIYIEPTAARGFGCEVYLWVRDSEVELDGDLFSATKRWLSEQWPFEQAAFPGREIAWCDWTGVQNR